MRDLSLAIEPRTFNVLNGPHGSGKNLLLRLLGLLETPDAGEIFLHDAPTRRLDAQVRAGIRNQHFGFMFADPFLLPSLSVLENIAMPLLKISASSTDEAHSRTAALLRFVELPEHGGRLVESLGNAERQRVSLARALVNQPEMLLVENLDESLSGTELESFWELLRRVIGEFGITVLSTAAASASTSSRVIEMTRGGIARDTAVMMPD